MAKTKTATSVLLLRCDVFGVNVVVDVGVVGNSEVVVVVVVGGVVVGVGVVDLDDFDDDDDRMMMVMMVPMIGILLRIMLMIG